MTSLLKKILGGSSSSSPGGGGNDGRGYGSIRIDELDNSRQSSSIILDDSTNSYHNNDSPGEGSASFIYNRQQQHEENINNSIISRLSFRNSIASISHLSGSVRGSLRNSLIGISGGSKCSVRDLGGQSTISKSSFNLIKNLVGAGVLALPSGV